MNLQLELSKAQALCEVIIQAYKRQIEGKATVDVLGALLVLNDQLGRLEEASEDG